MWTFKEAVVKVPKDVVESVPESVKPTEQIIDDILSERFVGSIARQWVNWAAGELGLPQKYYSGHPMTVQSVWVLYEACRRLKEEDNEKPTS
jgi:hypothetical protein